MAEYTISEDGTGADYSAAQFNSDTMSMTSGDIFTLLGTIRTILVPPVSGSVNNPITITGGQMSGGDIETGWTETTGEWESTGTYTITPSWVLVGGVPWIHGTEGSLAVEEWAYNGTTDKIWLGSNPTGKTVEIGARVYCINASNVDYIDILNIDIRCVRFGTGNSAINTATCDYINIRGCTFSYVSKATNFGTNSNNCECTGNTVTYCGDGFDNISGAGNQDDNILFDNNTGRYAGSHGNLYLNAAWLVTHSYAGDGELIASTNIGNNTIITNNDLKDCNYGVHIYHNNVGINPTNIIIESNIVENANSGGIWLTHLSATTIPYARVSTNIVIDCPGPGYGGLNADNITQLDIFNNYAENCANEQSTGEANYSYANCTGTTINFYNNISVNPRSGATNYHVVTVNTTANIDNNFYYDDGTGATPFWRSTIVITSDWATWQASHDANGINGFLPMLDSDYYPYLDSPCIGAGAWTGAIRLDKGGRPFKRSRPSIGAWEVANRDPTNRTARE